MQAPKMHLATRPSLALLGGPFPALPLWGTLEAFLCAASGLLQLGVIFLLLDLGPPTHNAQTFSCLCLQQSLLAALWD